MQTDDMSDLSPCPSLWIEEFKDYELKPEEGEWEEPSDPNDTSLSYVIPDSEEK